MKKYVCDVCGYVYDPAIGDPTDGIEPGTDGRMTWGSARSNCRSK